MVCTALMLNHWRKGKAVQSPSGATLPASAPAPWPHSFIHGAINAQEETRTTHARFGAISHGPWRTTSWCRSAARDTATGHAPASRPHGCRVPVHVSIRLRSGIPTSRQPRFVRRFRSSLSEACIRHGFRVVHYSIQRDHVHLLIEAHTNHSIACGMKSVGARIGKLANRLFQRKGKVLDGRYHLRPLRTPLEVHRALRYVLLNHRHHAAQQHSSTPMPSIPRVQPDPASSGRWFDGWRIATVPPNPTSTPKSPPPEPGYCTPPGAATGSFIPQICPSARHPIPARSSARGSRVGH